MKIKILCEFEVESLEDEETCGPVTENVARTATSQAVWDYLAFSNTGFDVAESVTVHADGFGLCKVTVGKEHE